MIEPPCLGDTVQGSGITVKCRYVFYRYCRSYSNIPVIWVWVHAGHKFNMCIHVSVSAYKCECWCDRAGGWCAGMYCRRYSNMWDVLNKVPYWEYFIPGPSMSTVQYEYEYLYFIWIQVWNTCTVTCTVCRWWKICTVVSLRNTYLQWIVLTLTK